MKHQEFADIIISEKKGKVISSRCNMLYFTRIGRIDLWEEMLSYSDIASDDLELSDRIWYYYTNTKLNLCKTCKVKYTRISRDNKEIVPRIYCSKECQHTDPELSEMMKERKAKTDQKVAQKKRAATMLKRFGYTTNSQRPEIKKRIGKLHSTRQLPKEVLDLINDRDWIHDQYITKRKTASVIASELGIDYSTIIVRLNRFGIDVRPSGGESYEERTLVDFIDTLGIPYERNIRKIIGKELDVYIPSKSLAIEYNGLFWHSIGLVNSEWSPHYKSHQLKTDLCEENGIDLISINSDWWLNSPNIVKGMIKSRLGLNERFFARKCEVIAIDNKIANQFHDDNHIQGSTRHRISLAIIKDNQILQVASFGKPRFNREYEWELIRLSSLIGTTVVGGTSRLIKAFRRDNPGSIISYCDRQYSSGNVYKQLGFKESHRTNPGYYWTDTMKLFHRTKFMKHKLSKLLDNYDENLSESQNMMNNRYRKYYDCGQIVYILE